MISFAALTSVGVCEKNDDRVMINGEIIADGMTCGVTDNMILAIICDGVGGYDFGDEAAEIACGVFAGLDKQDITKDILETAIDGANASVLIAQSTDVRHRNMSTTIAGIYIRERDNIVFNVGDTKVYRFRNSYLYQLSVDHTFSQESIDLGLVRSADEIDERDRHKITRCVGDANRCQPNISVGENRVYKGDIYLICSDGLSDVVGNDEIENILSEQTDISSRCEKLLAASIKNGSRDNISIILLEVT